MKKKTKRNTSHFLVLFPMGFSWWNNWAVPCGRAQEWRCSGAITSGHRAYGTAAPPWLLTVNAYIGPKLKENTCSTCAKPTYYCTARMGGSTGRKPCYTHTPTQRLITAVSTRSFQNNLSSWERRELWILLFLPLPHFSSSTGCRGKFHREGTLTSIITGSAWTLFLNKAPWESHPGEVAVPSMPGFAVSHLE